MINNKFTFQFMKKLGFGQKYKVIQFCIELLFNDNA